MKQLVVLVTGFGPFPGAPFNPTGQLVHRLARIRRPAFADVRFVTHVFPTSYRAVDRDLPRLLAKHAPDAVLMFGLASGSRGLRIETRARNAVSAWRDAEGHVFPVRSIVAGGPSALRFTALASRLLRAAREARVRARLSRDAGRYLCNYVSWRALEAAAKPGGPRVAAFVHVPKLRRKALRRRAGRQYPLGIEELVRGGEAMLLRIVAAARAGKRHDRNVISPARALP
jgi:pyroglutamyl-peptidase